MGPSHFIVEEKFLTDLFFYWLQSEKYYIWPVLTEEVITFRRIRDFSKIVISPHKSNISSPNY